MVLRGTQAMNVEKFLSRYEKITETGCWLWTGSLGGGGYGRAVLNKIHDNQHRQSWRAHYGEIPIGKCVLHKCDVKMCGNPKHLYLGTHSENSLDSFRRQIRKPFPPEKRGGKLTADQVREIRQATGSYASIGRRYGMWGQSMRNIKSGVSYTWVKDSQ